MAASRRSRRGRGARPGDRRGASLRRTALGLTALLGCGLAGCGPSYAGPPPAPPPPVAPPKSGAELLPSRGDLPPERRAIVVGPGGSERIVDAAEAEQAGFTLLDLAETWTPYIFAELADDQGRPMTNRYRPVFRGLASDSADGDGQPLGVHEHNYLELFGIPPTLAVLRARFLDDAPDKNRCANIDWTRLQAMAAAPPKHDKSAKSERTRLLRLETQLKAQLVKEKRADFTALIQLHPELKEKVDQLGALEVERGGFTEIERRLACEGMFPPRIKHSPGKLDEAMRSALLRFQMKHRIYERPAIRPDTLVALARTPLENDYQSLRRVLAERVTSAASILEDGTAQNPDGTPATYVDANGQTVPVRNLVDEALQAVLEQLALGSKEAALAFFLRHPVEDLEWLRAAVRLPKVPEYYGEAMDLAVEIDRGDVVYDPPFDEKGRPQGPGRKKFPTVVLRTRHRGQLVPLIRWRTTIGGWRSDLAPNGYEYFRYKGSDVGPRVWRNIVAGPVWIAPNSTPVRTLVKGKYINGASQMVVNYDEVGPGYLSAYGLVAAYNVSPGKNGKPDWDNGVRVHGSSEYLSAFNPNAYSHGCHRLMNHLAVRLFSFVLQHRPVVVEGDKPLNFQREFLWKDDVYHMRLPSRGFWFVLDPPVPVNVLEGNIIGRVKKPVVTYVPKPGVEYPPGPIPIPPDLPEARGGGGGSVGGDE